MSLVLVIVVFLTVVAAVFAFGAAVVTPSSVLGARLRALGTQQQQPSENKPAIRERLEQALDPISKAIPLSPADVSRTRGLLIQAGFRDAIDVNYYFGSRVLMGLIGFGAVALFSGFNNMPLLIGVSALGFLLPRFILKRRIRDRQNRIRLGLPDALDLTVICVEAGLALDQALMRVGQDLHHAHPDLSDEFHLVNLEMRAGKPRAGSHRHPVEARLHLRHAAEGQEQPGVLRPRRSSVPSGVRLRVHDGREPPSGRGESENRDGICGRTHGEARVRVDHLRPDGTPSVGCTAAPDDCDARRDSTLDGIS